MASLVLKMSVSLDGYVAPSDGSTNWIAAGASDDALGWTVETVSNAGAHLMGATTYAVMAAHWPGIPYGFVAGGVNVPTGTALDSPLRVTRAGLADTLLDDVDASGSETTAWYDVDFSTGDYTVDAQLLPVLLDHAG